MSASVPVDPRGRGKHAPTGRRPDAAALVGWRRPAAAPDRLGRILPTTPRPLSPPRLAARPAPAQRPTLTRGSQHPHVYVEIVRRRRPLVSQACGVDGVVGDAAGRRSAPAAAAAPAAATALRKRRVGHAAYLRVAALQVGEEPRDAHCCSCCGRPTRCCAAANLCAIAGAARAQRPACRALGAAGRRDRPRWASQLCNYSDKLFPGAKLPPAFSDLDRGTVPHRHLSTTADEPQNTLHLPTRRLVTGGTAARGAGCPTRLQPRARAATVETLPWHTPSSGPCRQRVLGAFPTAHWVQD
jgi:hypothetical protein